ncbi:hypothetical protein ACI77N_05120 [Pseudomonas sp. S191]|uniref:hypothetical protein n=1 Tax=Pseudomonas sp. S191 TaxID=579575 RepID=UPI00387A99E2
MKQVVTVLVVGASVVLMAGCAEIQRQAGAFLPQQDRQQIGTEGGQPVQTLGTGHSNQGSAQNAVAQEGSSVVSDVTKEAAGTLKNEVSSSIRSAIRGAFSR